MTTIRINLLPHRELKRAQQQKSLVAMMLFGALAGLAVVIVGHLMIHTMQDQQERRNAFLKTEIAKLDNQIKEIAQLKEKTNALLDRKNVVEALQANRTETVHLFDTVSRELPDGMYLKSLKQKGKVITISGYTQSSARVSSLMRNIEGSGWLAAPRLIEVSASTQNKQRVNTFSLEATQTIPSTTPAGADDKPATGANSNAPQGTAKQ